MEHEQDKFKRIRQAIDGRGTLFYRSHLSARGKKSGARVVFACPFHGEKNASFATYDDGRFHCFGCGAHGDAIDFLGKYRNLDPQAATAEVQRWLGLDTGRQGPAPADRVIRKYAVRDAAGELQATHVRTDGPTGKEFRWVTADGKNGLGGRSQNTLPLYNTEKLSEWLTGPVIIVEGEKTADHLTGLGLQALATFGANTVPDITNLIILSGRDVVLWPDDDTPGREHMRRVAEALQEVVDARVRVVITGDGESKQDAADLVTDRIAAEHILAECTEVFVYAPRADADPTDEAELAQATRAYEHTTLAHVAETLAETTWLWPSYIPRGYLTILAGEPGCGKSGLALWLAKTALQGDRWPDGLAHGDPVPKVLWLETDDCHGALRDRALAWDLPMADFIMLGKDGLGQVDIGRRNALPKLVQLVRETGVGFIVIDTLAGSHDQDENAATIKSAISTVAKLAQQCAVPVLATHHLRKRSAIEAGVGVSMDRVRGSTAIVAGARSIIGLDRFKTAHPGAEGPDRVRLQAIKANFCALPPPLVFTQTASGLAFEGPDEDAEAHSRAAFLHTPKATDIVLEAVRQRLQNGPASRQELIRLINALGYRELAFDRAIKLRPEAMKLETYKVGAEKYFRLEAQSEP